jgi:NAD-dependent deacetylase
MGEKLRVFLDNEHPTPEDLIRRLQLARHVVVFTGAGVSAESGIPTFRDALCGLWEHFDHEILASAEGFERDMDMVWGWYEWRRMQVMRVQPNPAHSAIAALVQHVPKLTVITQNVDDLHERAGSSDVLHLHGNLQTPRCFTCSHTHAFAPGVPVEPDGGRRLRPPSCTQCGGPIRPGVVWFGESLPTDVLNAAFAAAEHCDVLISIGTSGLVYPAASIPVLAQRAGAKVVQINPSSTPLDAESAWSLRGVAGVVMPQLLKAAFGG